MFVYLMVHDVVVLTGKRSRAVLHVLSPPPCVKEIRQSESHTNYHPTLATLFSHHLLIFVFLVNQQIKQ